MRSLVCLAALLVAVSSAPVLTDRQQKIKLIWGDDTNVTRAETILAEEAKRLGISLDDYFSSCSGRFCYQFCIEMWRKRYYSSYNSCF